MTNDEGFFQRQSRRMQIGEIFASPVVGLIFGIFIGIGIVINPILIKSEVTIDYLVNLSNACLTVSSINTAAILAIIAIFYEKQKLLSNVLFGILGFSFISTTAALYGMTLTVLDFDLSKLLIASSIGLIIFVFGQLTGFIVFLKWVNSQSNGQ